MAQELERVLVAGGGAAGWMTALALSTSLPAHIAIELVESEAIGIIGVGESTTPLIRTFNQMVGIDERDFMARTEASPKLGIEFVDWGRRGGSYFHGFGLHGRDADGVTPYSIWRRLRMLGDDAPLRSLCMATALANENRFAPPSNDPGTPAGQYDYAYQFDAILYARYLRTLAEANGVTRIEGTIADVALRGEDGFIDTVRLADGRSLKADFFIDCTGFRSLLLGDALDIPFEDWTHLLPVDRAWAVPTPRADSFHPFTRATACEAGWQWRIPLQHRTGNGHVFSSAFISDEQALDTLLANVDGAPLKDPMLLRFTTGYRKKLWHKNCAAIGLAGGFLEPLESTAILLIQTAIIRFLELRPAKSYDPALEAEFNRLSTLQYENIRDFILLHYIATKGWDTDFWRHMERVPVPASLQERIEMFRARGRILHRAHEGFFPPSWTYIFDGSDIISDDYDPLLDTIPEEKLRAFADRRRAEIGAVAARTPLAADYIAHSCPSDAFLAQAAAGR